VQVNEMVMATARMSVDWRLEWMAKRMAQIVSQSRRVKVEVTRGVRV
jgi:hypothetical protein